MINCIILQWRNKIEIENALPVMYSITSQHFLERLLVDYIFPDQNVMKSSCIYIDSQK